MLHTRLESILRKIKLDFENFDIYTKVCMNKYCSREFSSEQCFGLKGCSSCGADLRLKNEVQEDTRQRFQDKKQAEELIAELSGVLHSLEHVKFPTSGTPQKEAEEEVEVDDKLAKVHDLDSKFVQFKESFFKMRRVRRAEHSLDSLQHLDADSKIVSFYKAMNFRAIIDRELGTCPRERRIRRVD